MKHARFGLGHLLLCAACLHVAAAAGAHAAGRWGLAPGLFGEGGVASFASDGRVYRLQIAALEKTLGEEGAGAWLRAGAPVHVKLYSLSSALLGPVFGQSVLSVEPLNLLYYLGTLLLVYAVGREAFGEREGLVAAALSAGLLPTFLLHSTQLLKDPLFVAVALVLVLVSVKWLTTEYGLGAGLAAGLVGGAAAGSLWLIKNSAWWVVLAIMLLGAGLSLARQLGRRRLVAGNVAGVALMLLVGVGVSRLVTPYWLPKEYWMPHRPGAEKSEAGAEAAAAGGPAARDGAGRGLRTPADAQDGRRPGGRAPGGLLSGAALRVADARAQFVELYPGAASNVDEGVRFEGAGDVVRYLPRALLVGLCAPFPSMWLGAGGQAGAAGRLLGGAETLLMYGVYLLALVTLWRRRREPAVWMLALAALCGVLALGLVVVNVGALYRQRYLFWILLIVVAADAAARLAAPRAPGAGRPAAKS